MLLWQRAGKVLPALVGPRAVGRCLGGAPRPPPPLPRGCPGALVLLEGTAGLCGRCFPSSRRLPAVSRASPPQPRGKLSRRRRSGVEGRPRLEGSSGCWGLGKQPRNAPRVGTPPGSPQRRAQSAPALSATEPSQRCSLCSPGHGPPAPVQGGCRFSPVSVQAVETLVSPFDPNSKVMQCDLGKVV